MKHMNRIGCYLGLFVVGVLLIIVVLLASLSYTVTIQSVPSTPVGVPTSSSKWIPVRNLAPNVACDPSQRYECIPLKKQK